MCDHDATDPNGEYEHNHVYLYNFKTRIFFWNESSYANIKLNDDITFSYFTSNRFLFSVHKGNTKTKIQQAE